MKINILSRTITLTLILTGLSLFWPYSGFPQNDIIYPKIGLSIPCNIREMNIYLIRYERIDFKGSPMFEISKQDVYKIRYKNGVIDIIDPEYIKTKRDTLIGGLDTNAYSTLYVVYNSGQSSQQFPLVINGKYICKMRNHSRLEYKMHYQGEINVCRQTKKTNAPCRQFEVQSGGIYGILINVKNEYALNPYDRFSLTLINRGSIDDFLKTEYLGFDPFVEDDYHFELK